MEEDQSVLFRPVRVTLSACHFIGALNEKQCIELCHGELPAPTGDVGDDSLFAIIVRGKARTTSEHVYFPIRLIYFDQNGNWRTRLPLDKTPAVQI